MAELADAHGSGPCESNFMQVQVLLPAPDKKKSEPFPLETGSDFFVLFVLLASYKAFSFTAIHISH